MNDDSKLGQYLRSHRPSPPDAKADEKDRIWRAMGRQPVAIPMWRKIAATGVSAAAGVALYFSLQGSFSQVPDPIFSSFENDGAIALFEEEEIDEFSMALIALTE